MRLSLTIDDFHRLTCQFQDGDISTTAESADVGAGLEALSEALDDLETEGFGECFWFTSAGEYRWVLRRHESELVRLAVLWCGSVAVGFQHVLWHEMPLADLSANLRGELSRMAVATAAPGNPGTGRTA